jgi:hypothetical protein
LVPKEHQEVGKVKENRDGGREDSGMFADGGLEELLQNEI